jgi:hypothetical protein
LPELALDVVESTVARLPVEDYTAGYQAMRDAMGKGRKAGEGAAGLSKGNAKPAA